MKTFSIFIVTLSIMLQFRPASANCADIGQQAKESFAALVTAKETYKEEFSRVQSKPFTIQSLTEAIASNEKMKRAMDNSIDILSQSKAEGCFGKDTDKWATAIAQFRSQSDELGKTREMFLEMRSEMAKRSK